MQFAVTPGGLVVPHAGRKSAVRLDSNESIFFARQLEAIDDRMYEIQHPSNKGRMFIPTQGNVPDWAKSYTWRMFDKFGKAQFIGNASDNLPRADASGAEETRLIRMLGSAYGWDISEIKAAAATGTDLDQMKARAARFANDQLIEEVLAIGDASRNLEGLLKLNNVSSITPSTKQAGGTSWVNATSHEIVDDLFEMVDSIDDALNDAEQPSFEEFTILLPPRRRSLIARKPMGPEGTQTVLQFVLENSDKIVAIESWRFCRTAGPASTTRACCYPRDPMVVAGIVPIEFESLPPQQKNLEFEVLGVSTVGGVVCRYPVSVRYMDGI